MARRPVPYTFIPIVTEGENARPVFDAVFHQGQPGLLSGELQCELEALTPLFVGHYQYQVKDHKDVTSPGTGAVRLNGSWGLPNDIDVDKDKGFREPLFYGGDAPDQARVIIPGASLKGMLRHNIGAMLGAPMERVQEQFFSYRPNLQIQNGGRYECREAIVIGVDKNEEEKIVSISLIILSQGRHAYFVDREEKNQCAILRSHTLTPGEEVDFSILSRQEGKRRIKYGPGTADMPGGRYRVYSYRCGIDGDGMVATTLNSDAGQKRDELVVVPVSSINSNDVVNYKIEDSVLIQNFLLTKEELADTSHGHAKRKKETINAWLDNIRSDNIEENQLIYVDWDTQEQEVVSFGHNFRYRWRYRDTLLTEDGNPRPEVSSPDNENMTRDGGHLTGARLLFGYVDGADEKSSRDDGNRKLGIVADGDKESDAARLAGRISINAAIEQCDDPADLDGRFIVRSRADDVKGNHRYTIPLKILGQPKASAVEHYIQQHNNKLKTYGDLPGVPEDDTAGKLSGRKFYRHQKKAAQDQRTYEDIRPENLSTNQSGFAQFISKPGRKFRFTLRFKDLRDWELGAILLALNPDYHKPEGQEGPYYANKLGHGRPLGLGSVAIRVDAIHLLGDSGAYQAKNSDAKPYLDAFDTVVKDCGLDKNLAIWKQVLNYANSVECEYPNASHGHIYTYHTNIRAEYSKRRRTGENMQENFGEPVKPDYRGG